MSKKAIFSHASEELWIDVAAKLRDNYGWEICYFIDNKGRQKEKISKLFPHAVYHTKAEIRRNRVPDGCKAVMSAPLDKPLLSLLSEYESIFLKLMDRQNYNDSLSYFERISMYHKQIMYWKGVLEYFSPDVVVYHVEPHSSHEYALYALCRVMDISTVMFQRTSLPGFVYPVRSFEEGSESIREAYANALKTGNYQEVSLAPETVTHLENLSKTYADAMPFHLKYKLGHYKKAGDIGGHGTILYGVAKDLVKGLLTKREDLDKGPNYMRRKYHKSMGRFKRRKLLSHYKRLANDVNLAAPFVFVALQCEPERQTCPVGGVFGNQYLMIDMLSKLAIHEAGHALLAKFFDWEITICSNLTIDDNLCPSTGSIVPSYLFRCGL